MTERRNFNEEQLNTFKKQSTPRNKFKEKRRRFLAKEKEKYIKSKVPNKEDEDNVEHANQDKNEYSINDLHNFEDEKYFGSGDRNDKQSKNDRTSSNFDLIDKFSQILPKFNQITKKFMKSKKDNGKLRIKNSVLTQKPAIQISKTKTSHISIQDKNLEESRKDIEETDAASQINATSLDTDKMNKIYNILSSFVKPKPTIEDKSNFKINSTKNETALKNGKNTFKNQTLHSPLLIQSHPLPNRLDTTNVKPCYSPLSIIAYHPLITGMLLSLFLIFLMLLLICMYCLGKRSVLKSSKKSELDLSEKGFNLKRSQTSEPFENSLQSNTPKLLLDYDSEENSSDIELNYDSETLENIKQKTEQKKAQMLFKWIDHSISGISPMPAEEANTSDDTSDENRSSNIFYEDTTLKKEKYTKSDLPQHKSKILESESVPSMIDSVIKTAQETVNNDKGLSNHILGVPTIKDLLGNDKDNYAKTLEYALSNESSNFPSKIQASLSKNQDSKTNDMTNKQFSNYSSTLGKDIKSKTRELNDDDNTEDKNKRSTLSKNILYKPAKEKIKNKISAKHIHTKRKIRKQFNDFNEKYRDTTSEDLVQDFTTEDNFLRKLSSDQVSSKQSFKSKSNIFQKILNQVTRSSQESIKNEIDNDTLSSSNSSTSSNKSLFANVLKIKNMFKNKRISKRDKDISTINELKSILKDVSLSSGEDMTQNENLVSLVVKSGNSSKIDDMLSGETWERLAYKSADIGNRESESLQEPEINKNITESPVELDCNSFYDVGSSNNSLQDQIEKSTNKAEIRPLPLKPLLKHELKQEGSCALLYG